MSKQCKERKIRRYDLYDIKKKIKDIINCIIVLAALAGTIYLFYVVLNPELGAEAVRIIKELFR